MEKTFIDYYLLDETDILEKYSSNPEYQTLNPIEKALLVEVLSSKNPNKGVKILNDLRSEAETVKPNVSYENKLFETVLSLNIIKENQDDLIGHLREESEKIRERGRESERANFLCEMNEAEAYNHHHDTFEAPALAMCCMDEPSPERMRELEQELCDLPPIEEMDGLTLCVPPAYEELQKIRQEQIGRAHV